MKKVFLNMHLDVHTLDIKNLVKICCNSWKKKELLTLNKPIYVGNTVLELSKLTMYKFYYNFVKKKCKKCISLFTALLVYALKMKKIFIK